MESRTALQRVSSCLPPAVEEAIPSATVPPALLYYNPARVLLHIPSMYRTGWGFHAELEQFAAAALIWQRGIKPLRLVRQRHLARLRSGEASVNLASLPLELMCIIEDQIYGSSYGSIMEQGPFFFDCACEDFVDGLYDWQPFQDARYAYAQQYASDRAEQHVCECGECMGDEFSDSLLDAGLDAFAHTDRYDELWEEYELIHLENDFCEAEDRKEDAWLCILSTSEISDGDAEPKKEIAELLNAIRVFENDFGLVRLLPSYNSVGSARLASVPIFFKSYSRLNRRETRKNELLASLRIDKRRLARFQHVFKLSENTVGPEDSQEMNLSLITADLIGQELEEIEVDCKTVEEVEKHNARLMKKKRKTKAKKTKSTVTVDPGREEASDTKLTNASEEAHDAIKTA